MVGKWTEITLSKKIIVSTLVLNTLFIILSVFTILNINSITKHTEPIQEYSSITDSNISLQNKTIKICSNLSLDKTSECLIKEISKFYKYTITNDSIELSFDEIVERGGDCRNWAELYSQLGGELGFNHRTVRFTMINGVMAHRIAILSTDGMYCILDQLEFNCVPLLTYAELFPNSTEENISNGTS